jgi:hypothetical protein
MTRLQELLEIIGDKIGPELRDDIILDNFDNQEESYYEISGIGYYIWDRGEVIDELVIQYEDDVRELKKVLKMHEEFSHIIDQLYLDDIPESLARDFDYTELQSYDFVGRGDNYYIYLEQ